ncbi:MAG: MFS transporter [Pseudomonadota bacterium]
MSEIKSFDVTKKQYVQDESKFAPGEKKAIAIVLTGNFLEYFDLMLFSHLAFVISPYFMPKEDPLVAKMLSILTFCSAFAVKPLAAYFWGYLGDNFGRVVVLSYTTIIMALTCMLIPNIPPYAEWGIYSTVAIIMCRMLQGFSSAGESKCAEVFIVEILPNLPKIFIASVLVPITCDLGGFFAAIIGSLCLAFSPEEGWKIAFYVGAAIAFSSSLSRLKLRETKEFLNKINHSKKTETPLRQYFERRNFIALLGLNLICPTAFYFAYSVCSDLLKEKVGLSASTIVFNNSFLLLSEIFFLLFCARLASRHHPFLILKVRTYASFVLMPLSFIAILFYPNHFTIFMTQVIAILSTASFDPAAPIVIKSFGISTRFSKYAKASAFAKAIMYLSTGYLTFYLEKLFGLWGVLGLLLFFSGIFLVSLYVFVPADKMTETYKNYLNKKGLYFSQLDDDSVDLSEFNNDEKAKSPDFNKHQQNLLKRWLAQ